MYVVTEEVEVSVTGHLLPSPQTTKVGDTVIPLAASTEESSQQEDEEHLSMNGTNGNQRKLDQFGFILNMDSNGNMTTTEHRKKKEPTARDMATERRRERKWSVTMDAWKSNNSSPSLSPRVMTRRLRKGIPDAQRGNVWVQLLSSSRNRRQVGMYQEILHKTSHAMLENCRTLSAKNLPSLAATAAVHGTSVSEKAASPTSTPTTPTPVGNAANTETSKDEDYASSDAFRLVQDIIERDIHRTYPRHDLFFEEDRHNGNTEDHASFVKSASILLGGYCDPDLASIVLNLESDLKVASQREGENDDQVLSSETTSSLDGVTQRPKGQAALRRVLRAYSYYDREVGYCQGMNYIAGMFLTRMSEEDAFWLLVCVMYEKPCAMRGLFGEGMKETHKVLYVAERLVHHHLPRLARHFDREHIDVTMYATQWLLTQYTSSFQFDLVVRVWDCFLCEGWKIIYRVMLALLQQFQSQLLKMSFEEILAFFRDLADKVDGDSVMETALRIPLRTKVIVKYEKEWYAKQDQNNATSS